MTKDTLQNRIRLVRRDLGNLLFHFTRTSKTDDKTISASGILYSILKEGKLLGSSHFIKGNYNCVCFTESPIEELTAVFNLNQIASDESLRPRYDPYGIAVPKDWLFKKGGRPVIYQPDAEFDSLPEALRWRHVRYDGPSSKYDFTWEREWRIWAEEIALDPNNTLVVVPTAEEAFDIAYETAEIEVEYDTDPFPTGSFHKPKWMTVSLDLLGMV